METLVRFFDEVDDVIVATALRLQRYLSPRPRERRKAARLRGVAARPVAAPGTTPVAEG